MTVRRIVANLPAADPAATAAFYRDLLGLDIVMDQGWIVTLATTMTMQPQVSLAGEGGGGTPLPAISIEVDDVDTVYRLMVDSRCRIIRGLTREPWGVRRFFVEDPAGNLVNVLSHDD